MTATNSYTEKCDFRAPCGYCAKWDKKYDRKMPEHKHRDERNIYDGDMDAISSGIGLTKSETMKSLDADNLPSGIRKD